MLSHLWFTGYFFQYNTSVQLSVSMMVFFSLLTVLCEHYVLWTFPTGWDFLTVDGQQIHEKSSF